MKGVFAFLAVACFYVVCTRGSLHASCKIEWTWGVSCTMVRNAILKQIDKWKSDENCKNGGEKCLYTLKGVTATQIKATHKTPKAHYIDDLTFTVQANSTSKLCNMQGYSTSELWYAILDYGTNYCNLHNLITGAALDRFPGYKEVTSDSVCTQYSSANCEKY